MFVPKFDIYNAEWLDLIFKDRNQSYGAYELRKHYTRTLFRSMGITAIILLAVFLVALSQAEPAVISPAPSSQTTFTIDLNKEITIEKTLAQVSSVKHRHNGGAPAVIPVRPAVNSFGVTTAAILNQGTMPLSSRTKPTINAVACVIPITKALTQLISDFPDVMPEPNGGTEALNIFLKQNLLYPESAAKNGISGQVIVSFVVETDGRLSGIKVTRSAGFGFDEEAIRVLKLAPAWLPGSQSGHPVRVRYSMPVNFRIVR